MTIFFLLLGAVILIICAAQKDGCRYLTCEYEIEGDEANVTLVMKTVHNEICCSTYDGAGWMRAVISISVLHEKQLKQVCDDLKLTYKRLESVW